MAEYMVLVEDDSSIREMLAYYLQSVGHEVSAFESAEAYLAFQLEKKPSMFILDIMLTGMDGLALLRRIRDTRDLAQVPVIMLTARTSEMDKVKGLDSGADDYMVKPFGIMELQARINALLRRTSGPKETDGHLSLEDLELDVSAREVRRKGELIDLTYKEFELLNLLIQRRGAVLSRDEILQAVWDYDFAGETRTVDMHIKSLRQKIGEGHILTVRGVGYKIR